MLSNIFVGLSMIVRKFLSINLNSVRSLSNFPNEKENSHCYLTIRSVL